MIVRGIGIGIGLALGLLAGMAGAEEARHERGRGIYNFRCYFCHGYSGDARTLAATYLVPPPRDFTRTPVASLSREAMLAAVTHGKSGTGMAGFETILNLEERELVVDFVRVEFMERRAENTRYHTVANGWPDHERNRVAFPFATGDLALDTPDAELTPEQRRGKGLFLATCVSCHDRARVRDEGPVWEPRPVSFPRAGYSHQHPPDAVSGASPYGRHDIPPVVADLTPQEREGEALFQKNCAFCHGADGTGRNWIGSFLEPHPRDLTDPAFRAGMTTERWSQVIRDGLPGTSMPAWGDVLTPSHIQAVIGYIGRMSESGGRE